MEPVFRLPSVVAVAEGWQKELAVAVAGAAALGEQQALAALALAALVAM